MKDREPVDRSLNRRDFLRLSGLGAAAMLAAGCAPPVVAGVDKSAQTKGKISSGTDFVVDAAELAYGFEQMVPLEKKEVIGLLIVDQNRPVGAEERRVIFFNTLYYAMLQLEISEDTALERARNSQVDKRMPQPCSNAAACVWKSGQQGTERVFFSDPKTEHMTKLTLLSLGLHEAAHLANNSKKSVENMGSTEENFGGVVTKVSIWNGFMPESAQYAPPALQGNGFSGFIVRWGQYRNMQVLDRLHLINSSKEPLGRGNNSNRLFFLEEFYANLAAVNLLPSFGLTGNVSNNYDPFLRNAIYPEKSDSWQDVFGTAEELFNLLHWAVQSDNPRVEFCREMGERVAGFLGKTDLEPDCVNLLGLVGIRAYAAGDRQILVSLQNWDGRLPKLWGIAGRFTAKN